MIQDIIQDVDEENEAGIIVFLDLRMGVGILRIKSI